MGIFSSDEFGYSDWKEEHQKVMKYKKALKEIKEIAQYDVYTSRTDLCLKLNWIKKKINEVLND